MKSETTIRAMIENLRQEAERYHRAASKTSNTAKKQLLLGHTQKCLDQIKALQWVVATCSDL